MDETREAYERGYASGAYPREEITSATDGKPAGRAFLRGYDDGNTDAASGTHAAWSFFTRMDERCYPCRHNAACQQAPESCGY